MNVVNNRTADTPMIQMGTKIWQRDNNNVMGIGHDDAVKIAERDQVMRLESVCWI